MPDQANLALEITGLSKHFGGVYALRDMSLAVAPGEIHGLIGRNGSGKSTLIKILSGYHHPDEGAITVNGKPVAASSSRLASGLSFVQQDMALAPQMTVRENFGVGQGESAIAPIRRQRERDAVREALRAIGADRIRPEDKIADVHPGDRALVAIARALHRLDVVSDGHGVLILDEPTSYLAPGAVARVLDAMRHAAQRSAAVLFVSHRLAEIMQVTDQVSVLRNGLNAGTFVTAQSSQNELIEAMLGEAPGEFYPDQDGHAHPDDVALGVHELTGAVLTDVTFSAAAGEVLGVTGLAGMGQDELPYLLVGAERPRAGRITVVGTEIAASRMSPRLAKRRGLMMLPADRLGRSGVSAFPVRENLTLPALSRFFRRGFLHKRLERAHTARLLTEYDIQPKDPDVLLSTLSGGNQQRVLLAKWLQLNPKVLVLHEATHGVDVRAKKGIFEVIAQIAQAKCAVVMVSSEYADLANLCDRVLIVRDGRIVSELSGTNLVESRVTAECYREPTDGDQERVMR